MEENKGMNVNKAVKADIQKNRGLEPTVTWLFRTGNDVTMELHLAAELADKAVKEEALKRSGRNEMTSFMINYCDEGQEKTYRGEFNCTYGAKGFIDQIDDNMKSGRCEFVIDNFGPALREQCHLAELEQEGMRLAGTADRTAVSYADALLQYVEQCRMMMIISLDTSLLPPQPKLQDYNPLQKVEEQVEGNYDMIDGFIDNLLPPQHEDEDDSRIVKRRFSIFMEEKSMEVKNSDAGEERAEIESEKEIGTVL